jgi:hypothetical protein
MLSSGCSSNSGGSSGSVPFACVAFTRLTTRCRHGFGLGAARLGIVHEFFLQLRDSSGALPSVT